MKDHLRPHPVDYAIEDHVSPYARALDDYIDYLEGLVETANIVSDPETMSAIKEAQDEADQPAAFDLVRPADNGQRYLVSRADHDALGSYCDDLEAAFIRLRNGPDHHSVAELCNKKNKTIAELTNDLAQERAKVEALEAERGNALKREAAADEDKRIAWRLRDDDATTLAKALAEIKALTANEGTLRKQITYLEADIRNYQIGIKNRDEKAETLQSLLSDAETERDMQEMYAKDLRAELDEGPREVKAEHVLRDRSWQIWSGYNWFDATEDEYGDLAADYGDGSQSIYSADFSVIVRPKPVEVEPDIEHELVTLLEPYKDDYFSKVEAARAIVAAFDLTPKAEQS